MIPKPNKCNRNPLSYGPITLLESLRKTLERINYKLKILLIDVDLFNKQFGFRPHHSTQDENQLPAPRNIYDTRLFPTKDIEKAFDTLWLEGFKNKRSIESNPPSPTVKHLSRFLTHRRMTLGFKTVSSDVFPLGAGVPQGSPLPPTLYIPYTSDLPDTLYATSVTLQYANEVIQHIKSTN